MSSLLIRRFVDTPLGESLYGLYRVGFYPLFFWTRYRFAKRRHDASLPPAYMKTGVRAGGRAVTIEHRRESKADILAILQCFGENQYDMPDGAQGRAHRLLYQQIVASGRKPLIIDCGANIGASAVWFAHRFPAARIIAIEPAPGNCELLRRNTAPYDVEIRQAGVSASDGVAYLTNPTGEDMEFQVSDVPTDIQVPLVSIATLLAENPDLVPFLLKVDIEGGEKALFSGNLAAIDRFPLIIMEPHDWMMPGQLPSRDFFRFHVDAGREFALKHENVASIAVNRQLV